MDQKDEIKQKLDIVDVISTYIELKKAGKNYKGVCPFHSEKTPSFMVSPELQMYKCFGCGASGDVYTFIQNIEGVDFGQALELMADRAGIKLKKTDFQDDKSKLKRRIYNINETTAKFYSYLLLKHPAGKKALEYLTKDRKLSLETIKDFNLGYAPDNWDSLYKFLKSKKFTESDMLAAGVIAKRSRGTGYIDKFKGRIMFPFTENGGRIVGFTGRTLFDRNPKYLNTSESPVFHKSGYLYGLKENRVNIKQEGVVMVEGQVDVVKSFDSGIKNVVCSSGTSLTDTQLILLSRYTKDITFCFDSDTAGINAAYRAVSLAEKHDFNIKLVLIPEEVKDLDGLLKKDVEKAKKLIKNAIPAYDYFFITQIKKHDKKSATGKKQIIEELSPLYSKISNPVMRNHYFKKIAEELALSEKVVTEMFDNPETAAEKLPATHKEKTEEGFDFSHDTESYLMGLLLKCSVEDSQKLCSKVALKDLENEDLSEILSNLKKYIEGRKRNLNINTFISKNNERLHDMIRNLYLWDFENLDAEHLLLETEKTIRRIKKASAKRQMYNLTEKIKLAEVENNSEEIKRLTKKIENLSKSLI